jgi:hypothetical protein
MTRFTVASFLNLCLCVLCVLGRRSHLPHDNHSGFLGEVCFVVNFILRQQLFFQAKGRVVLDVIRIHQNAVDRLFFVLAGFAGL